MRRIVKLDRAHRVLAMFLAIVMVVSAVPLSVFAASSGELSTDIGEKEFVVGTATEFTFTTTANDDADKMVKGSFVFSDPDAIEKLEYKESQDGNWYEFYGDFGPATGFPMRDATSHFRVTFKEAGVYTVEAFMKTVDEGTVLCSTTAAVLVRGRSVLSTNIEEKTFVVGEATEFEFSTMANEDADRVVIGTFEFSDPDAIEKLEYKESKDGNWYEFDGDFGPAEGFPMSNATSLFKATFSKAGTYSVTASMKEVGTGDVLCFEIANVTVKERSAIRFEKETLEIKYSDKNVINDSLVDAVIGAEYTYESDNEAVVTVDENGALIPVGIGDATITVTRKENANYVSASATYAVKVVAGEQNVLTWDKTVPDSIEWNVTEGYSNTVSGGSGTGAVVYTSDNDEVASVDSATGVLTMKKPGTVVITATKDGGTLYDDLTASYTLRIVKSEQAPLAFGQSNPSAIYVGDTLANVATGGSTAGTVTYVSSDDSIASVDANGVVTALRVPNGAEFAAVTVTASLEGNELYEDATPVSYTLTIYRAPQKTPLVFDRGSVGQTVKYSDFYVNAVRGGDTAPITYKSSDDTIATVDADGNVTTLKAGVVTITASVPQTEEFEAQTLSYELVIERGDQEIIFDKGNSNIPAITYGGFYQNTAYAITKVTYESSDADVADVGADGKLIIKKAGTVVITATAEETEQYAEASSSYTITINKAKQNISFEKGENVVVTFNDNENKFSNSASSNATNGNEEDRKEVEVLYSIVSGSEFVVDGTFDSATGYFEIKGAGTIIVAVSFSANDRYAANMASYTVIVEKDDQTIAFEKSEYGMINGDKSFAAPIAAECGDFYGIGAIVYAIENNDDGVVSAIDSATGALTFTNATGKVTVTATKTADDNYNEATVSYVLTVEDAKIGENVFHTIVGEKLDVTTEWYTGNVSVKAADGYLLSYAKTVDTAEWNDVLTDAVANDGTYNVTFYVRHVESGIIYEAQTVTVHKDATDPEAVILHEKLSGWEKFLSIITVGIWEPAQMNFTIESSDITSGKKSVEYLVVEGTNQVMSEEALDATSDWKEYVDGISVDKDKIFVVYAKVTDHAGQHIYATTNGVVFDKTPVDPENIKFNVLTSDHNGFYGNDGNAVEDVEINVQIDDALPSSGIKSVSYEVLCNGIQTQNGVLFSFNVNDPTYDLLVPSWNSADEGKNIVVDSELNNSDNVKVIVTVEDNAGNVTSKELPLKICINKPTIEVTYVDDPTAVQTHEGVTYYNANRVAKIVITGRTSVFTASNDPVVTVSETLGDTAQRSTYEVIDWETKEGETPDEATHTYWIYFNGSANYEFSVEYTDIFGHELSYTSGKFTVDHDDPTATITVGATTWDKLLAFVTFGLYSNETVNVSAEPFDATSVIKSFEMYRVDNSGEILNTAQLDELYANGEFVKYEDFTVAEDAKFVLYLRAEDYAGHYTYVCSDGYVVDMKDAEIAITPEDTELFHNGVPLYNGDVDVAINVVEKNDETFSGIKEVKYWVTCDGEISQPEEILYSFNVATPKYEDLLHEFTKTVTIESEKNNSCNVVLYVTVTDNAGNVKTESVAVDIDITDPTIQVEYDNNSPYKVVGERGYYSANRTATVTLVERTGHFETAKATAGIKVKAVDAKGEPIVVNGSKLEVDSDGYLVDITKLFGTLEWNTTEGATPDEAVHTLVLPYLYDANYTFSIEYADLASNGNEGVNTDAQETPYEFTIDKVDPTATITVASNTWDKLLDFLTFGLFSNENVKVSATSDDVTSPIESIEYYKTNETAILNASVLEEITTWTDITANPEFEISEDEKFVVYLKITDYAGNYMYINSDGYVVDKTLASITLTPDATDLDHNDVPLYNDDVNVLINVVEKKDEAYSGIKEVKYWVTCDGEISQPEEILYSFNVATPKYEDLLHEFTKTVTIESEKNNSCNVVLYVTVTDNAGNVKTESVAVDIDITTPEIAVEFNDNAPRKVVDEKGYFPKEAARIATVVITERPEHFEASKATESIVISAIDAKGDVVITDCSALVGEWKTEGAGDAAKHTAIIDFTADANYEFTLSYKDLAGNDCAYEEVQFADGTVTPRYFAVDKTKPEGSVTVETLGTWDKLVETLTFGLWSKETVKVTGTNADLTSPVESVSYYKTPDITEKSISDLNKIETWLPFDGENGFDVKPDERFVVYVKIVDFAGNVEYISTNGIIVDETEPIIESVKPEITITPEPTNGIYNSDVTVAVSVYDPKVGGDDVYAGLREIRYEIYNMGVVTQEGVLYSFVNEAPSHDDLLQSWSKKDAILVDKNLNNSNDVKIVVYAVDNAGNKNNAECEIKIDVTAPEIEVTYDNNDGDTSFADGTYFDANRTAKIVVTERNFDSEMVKLIITNTDGYVPALSDWTTVTGDGNGDGTTHTAYVVFDRDGDYTLEVSATDKAMNENNAVTYGNSLAPTAFTVDKTAPVVSVVYDNNDVFNGNYYKAQRVATITVTEHNFETGRVRITLRATDDGVASALPHVSNWTSRGDVHTATIVYSADSLYAFDFDYADKAGNVTADIPEQSFYVDKTNPILSIEKIVDESANNTEGNIGFVMTASDTNFDVFVPVLTAVIKKGDGFETKELTIGEVTNIKNGKVFTVTNLEDDGIYRITCTIIDKAGNAYSEVTLEKADGTKYVEHRSGDDTLLTFSVNRDGSTFEVDENTMNIVDHYYVQNVENDVEIVEINADPLKEQAVTLNDKTLEKGKDYTVSEEGGNGAWMKYTYKVNKELFAEEGEYKLVVSSKDKADNDAFSDVKEAAVAFVVDRTAPVVTVSGIATDGRYQTDKQLVTLIPTDDGGALKALVVNLVDEDGKVMKEVINLVGDALIAELDANGGKITFEMAEGLYQNVQIICTDYASGEGEDTNTHDTTIENVSVSTSVFMIFWANKPLRWGTIGGVTAVAIAVAVFFIQKKKRNA